MSAIGTTRRVSCSVRWVARACAALAVLTSAAAARAGTAPDGTACSTGSECASGHCVDSVCCASASCNTGWTCAFPGKAGTCLKPIGSSACSPTTCGSGNCVNGVCCASATCPTGSTCAYVSKLGTCWKDDGTACTSDAECGSGYCTDGFCCNVPCRYGVGGDGSMCRVCNRAGIEGHCSAALPGPPPRGQACQAQPANIDAKCLQAWQCTGSYVCGAVAKTPLPTCAEAGCSADAQTYYHAATCNPDATCPARVAEPCAGFRCDAVAGCLKACATDADCASGFTCAIGATTGKCVTKTGATCSADGMTSIALGGAETACGAYRCSTSSGLCRDSCASTDDCAPGGTCDLGASPARCVGAASPTADDGGCALVPGAQGPAFAAVIFGIGGCFALWGRRRRVEASRSTGAR